MGAEQSKQQQKKQWYDSPSSSSSPRGPPQSVPSSPHINSDNKAINTNPQNVTIARSEPSASNAAAAAAAVHPAAVATPTAASTSSPNLIAASPSGRHSPEMASTPKEHEDTPFDLASPIAFSPDQIAEISFHFQRPPLGKGGFSTVYEGEYCHHPVAVKILTIRNPNERHLFDIELAVLSNENLRHSNLLPLIGFCIQRPALVMPRLKPLNRDRLPRLPGSVRMKVAMDVARGLAHMHQAGFVHNDMKPDNVLLEFDEERHIRRALVGDLGCAKSVMIPVQPFGTILFMDPGLNPSGPPMLPKPADDVYSFGLTIVCIFTNAFPESAADLLRMWATIDATFPHVANLARRMTAPNPALRPSCAIVLQELQALDEGWRRSIAATSSSAAFQNHASYQEQQQRGGGDMNNNNVEMMHRQLSGMSIGGGLQPQQQPPLQSPPPPPPVPFKQHYHQQVPYQPPPRQHSGLHPVQQGQYAAVQPVVPMAVPYQQPQPVAASNQYYQQQQQQQVPLQQPFQYYQPNTLPQQQQPVGVPQYQQQQQQQRSV